MSIFDSLKTFAEETADHDAHAAIGQALDNSPLGGMDGLLDTLHEGGLDHAVESWAEGDEYVPVTVDQLKSVLDDDHVKHIAASLGLSSDQVLAGLAEHLPALAAAHIAADDHDDSDEDHDHAPAGAVAKDEPTEA